MPNTVSVLSRSIGTHHRSTVWLAASFIVLAFFPYVAVPLGSNTNVSLAALVGILLSFLLARFVHMTILAVTFLTLPFLATLVRILFHSAESNANAYITSIFSVVTVFGAASSLYILRDRTIPLLRCSIFASCLIAIAQKYFFLDRGIVPWIELYNIPGYASVAANAETIGLYIRRPFGLFPEPSFLAGTVALASAALLLLKIAFMSQIGWQDWLVLVLTTFTIFISDSGSGIVCIAILALSIFVPVVQRNRALLILLPLVLTAAIGLGLAIANSRQGGGNTSWNDRLASIVGGMRLLTEDPVHVLVGLGRGMVPSYFQAGKVQYLDITVYSYIPDIYSVIGRILMENGVLFGAPFIFWLALLILRLGGKNIKLVGCLFLVLWIVVAGLTISYETAAWIWILPGLCLGTRLLTNTPREDTMGRLNENTARS